MGVASAAGAATHPTLRVLQRDPLVVRGEGFRTGERVTVTALTGLGPHVVRTNAVRGTFKAEFKLSAQPCATAFAVRARGNLGSTAFKALGARPCVPPPRD